jgi:hypothetical protein
MNSKPIIITKLGGNIIIKDCKFYNTGVTAMHFEEPTYFERLTMWVDEVFGILKVWLFKRIYKYHFKISALGDTDKIEMLHEYLESVNIKYKAGDCRSKTGYDFYTFINDEDTAIVVRLKFGLVD